MRKLSFIFICASICFVLSIVSCEKSKPPPGAQNNDALAGKWNVDNRVINEYNSDTLTMSTTEPADGSTWDFKDNGQVIIIHPGSNPETHTYAIQAGSKVDIDGFVFDIRDLTTATVTLYIRHDFLNGDYDEVFTNLKR
jgi:hypothetical protein